MKFVADVMLGRLARLMRFSGYDVEYDSGADDETLLEASRRRTLLTKDHELAARASKRRGYLVRNIGALRQLEEIRRQFPLSISVTPRCLDCNVSIRKLPKRKVEHLVPPYVFARYTRFHVCPRCRKVYWQGTHFEHLLRMLK